MKKRLTILFATLFCSFCLVAQTAKPPIMGWSSWNNYRVNINEEIIRAQAYTMATNGMKDAGYTYINIDDGFFGGRNNQGDIICHTQRFPSGMRNLSDYIHSLGFKAGIYTDAGSNTCASRYDKDTIGSGCGLYGNDYRDIYKFLNDWNFDFLKVDWCGGESLGLDEQSRYTEISNIIRKLRPDAIFNICRWQFPGKWAIGVADSWRISGDISDKFASILRIIDINAELWPYCSAGHYNDMDMLQVGRGMSYEEDKTHFTMWCIMVSPLLAGNDLTTMSEQTLDILTNKEIIEFNQDPLFYQARRLASDGDFEIWAKPLKHTMSGEVAVVLLNRSNTEIKKTFTPSIVGLDVKQGYVMRDVWNKKNYALSTEQGREFTIPAHGVVAIRIGGKSKPFNIFQRK